MIMTSRDQNADRFEKWVRNEVLKSDLSAAEDNGKCTLEVKCPYCKPGKVRMEINLRCLTVAAECSEFGYEGKCITPSVRMPLNVFKKVV